MIKREMEEMKKELREREERWRNKREEMEKGIKELEKRITEIEGEMKRKEEKNGGTVGGEVGREVKEYRVDDREKREGGEEEKYSDKDSKNASGKEERSSREDYEGYRSEIEEVRKLKENAVRDMQIIWVILGNEKQRKEIMNKQK